MSFNRLHVASVLSLACLLGSGCALDATETGAASDEPVASTSEAVNRGSSMAHGSVLNPGDTLYSSDGRVFLIMQTDGNLVLYFSPHGTWTTPIWASNTGGNPGAWAIFQYDGNLVVYTQDVCWQDPKLRLPVCTPGNPLWATGTNGKGASSVALQNDGNLVLYNSNNSPLWATNTENDVPDSAHCLDSFCPAGSWWKSCGQHDGQLVFDCSTSNGGNPNCDGTVLNYLPGNMANVTNCWNHEGTLNCTTTTGTWMCNPYYDFGACLASYCK